METTGIEPATSWLQTRCPPIEATPLDIRRSIITSRRPIRQLAQCGWRVEGVGSTELERSSLRLRCCEARPGASKSQIPRNPKVGMGPAFAARRYAGSGSRTFVRIDGLRIDVGGLHPALGQLVDEAGRREGPG